MIKNGWTTVYLSLCEAIMIMLRGRSFKEKIKIFGKIEK